MYCIKAIQNYKGEMNMKHYIGEITVIIIGICFIISITIGGWYCARKINYNLSYKSMVQETVKEIVKKECLK